MESNRIEYKQELTNDLEKEVVAFLNYPEGGTIFIGIDKLGNSIGVKDCDSVQLKIKDRLINNIQPSVLGLFDIIHEQKDNLDIVRITVAGGQEKPYYLKKYGMSPKGCFIRIGSACQSMNQDMIEELFRKRTRNTLCRMASPRQELSFRQLKIFYDESGLKLNDNFKHNLEFLTPDDKLNYAAYLLADDNSISIKVGKYSGTTRANLIENREFGNCSILKALQSVLDHLDAENRVFTEIAYPKRKEQYMIAPTAMREAVVNAIIHNDYAISAPPKFEFFSDRLEITSMGGLPEGIGKDDFFSGLSVPRNKELMRIFRDLELVEHLGSGIPRILENYSKDVFELKDNYIRVVLPYQTKVKKTTEKKTTEKKTTGKKLKEKPLLILKHCDETPNITIPQLAQKLDITEDGINFHLRKLKDKGYLQRIGGRKQGYWQVLLVEANDE